MQGRLEPSADAAAAVDSLAARMRQRIARAYGGNQRAFANATGLTPQHVYAILSGKIVLPRPAIRRALARELGLSHPELLALAGELDPAELRVPPSPLSPEAQELERIVEQLPPSGQDALLALARELLRQLPTAEP
jgi:transcriptional regulator with XRE-family HTH domain